VEEHFRVFPHVGFFLPPSGNPYRFERHIMATIDQTADSNRPITGTGDARPASERFAEQASAVSQDILGMGAIARDVAHEKLEEFQGNASAVYEQGQDRVRTATRTLEQFIAEKPLTSVLIAAGVGLFLGRFWMRR
jgi:ElaB/YqjD/DUF883 family membrane-anchored ribosome-binding protein